MYSAFTKILLAMALLWLGISTGHVVLAQSGTVNADPDFDLFYGSGDGTSGPWKPFYNSTPHPTIWKHLTEGWPKGPSLFIYADTMSFDAGVYQVVPVTPGHGYHFQVAWAVVRHGGVAMYEDVQLVRMLGIDPFGGTNPLSPNVRWSGEYFGSGKFPPELAIDDYARNTQITIFIRAQNRYTSSRNEVFFDHALLTDNGSTTQVTLPTVAPTAAPATVRAATATRVPPTATRPRVALAPTATNTAEPTTTFTATLPPTSTNTSAPTATRTPRATPTLELEPGNDNPLSQAPSWLLGLGMVACVIGAGGLVVLAGVAYWFLRRR